jgi:hypothetical protein
LSRLDELRSRALRNGDEALLDSVYVGGSLVLRADRKLVQAYAARGLRLRSPIDYLSARVMNRGADAVALAVVDQVRAPTATTASGTALALPADRPTSHVIVLRRVAGRWLIARVSA